VQQIVAAHSRLARNARGDHDNVGVRRGRVVVRAGHVHVALLDRHGFQQIESLALRHAFHHVNQGHIGQLFGRNPMRGRGAHVAGADNRNLLTHDFSQRSVFSAQCSVETVERTGSNRHDFPD
jgi:hypothetical protein